MKNYEVYEIIKTLIENDVDFGKYLFKHESPQKAVLIGDFKYRIFNDDIEFINIDKKEELEFFNFLKVNIRKIKIKNLLKR